MLGNLQNLMANTTEIQCMPIAAHIYTTLSSKCSQTAVKLVLLFKNFGSMTEKKVPYNFRFHVNRITLYVPGQIGKLPSRFFCVLLCSYYYYCYCCRLLTELYPVCVEATLFVSFSFSPIACMGFMVNFL